MTKIKNIIFDLGGVLLNIDFNRTTQAFQQLGVSNFEQLYSKEAANPLFEDLETGKISNEDFYAELLKHCRPGTSLEEMEQAWNAILLDFRKESIHFLHALKNRYNIYLLSNTNRIHHAAFSAMFRESFGGEELNHCFTKAWYSHLLQQRKPYPETYRLVLEAGQLDAEETLFIDDSVANIEGAKAAGLHVKLLSAAERIETIGL